MRLLINLLADGTLLIVLSVAAASVLQRLRRHMWEVAPVLVMAGLTSLLVGKLLSLLYQPAVARPFIELGLTPGAAYVDNPGFPSDHALLGTVAVIAVYQLGRDKRVAYLLAALVVVMCVARVVALVHTPLDVIGGIVAGCAGVMWYRKLTKSTKSGKVTP